MQTRSLAVVAVLAVAGLAVLWLMLWKGGAPPESPGNLGQEQRPAAGAALETEGRATDLRAESDATRPALNMIEA